MPDFNVTFFEFNSQSTFPNTIGSTFTMDQANFDATFGAPKGSMVVTDDDNIFREIGGVDGNGQPRHDAEADITESDGTVNTDISIDLGKIWVYTWTDGGGVVQTTEFGRVDVFLPSGLETITVIKGEVPPVGTEMTLTSVINSVNDLTGFLYSEIICFTRGTMILTDRGEVAVEDLEAGDMVLTRDRGAQPLRWVGSRTVPAEGALAPITIKAGVLGNDRDLTVSPAHRVLIEGWKAEALFGQREVLATARQLTVRDDVFAVEGGEVEYFHLLFDNHEIVTANGAAAESLNPSDLALDALETEQRAEIRTLFPELLTAGAFPIARRMLRDTDIAALY
ncbi:Hint domain-containing protein [Halovulum sp. GXIMD14794]